MYTFCGNRGMKFGNFVQIGVICIIALEGMDALAT